MRDEGSRTHLNIADRKAFQYSARPPDLKGHGRGRKPKGQISLPH